MERKNKHFWCINQTLLMLVFGLTACGDRPVPTPSTTTPSTQMPVPTYTSQPTAIGAPVAFETIDQDSVSGVYGPPELQVFLIKNREGAEQIKDWISPGASQSLVNLNFEQYLAIAAFRGRKPTSGYDIIIQRIVRQDGRLVVEAQLWEPSPFWEVATAAFQYYHLVKIPRSEGLDEAVELLLQGQAITPTPPPNLPPGF